MNNSRQYNRALDRQAAKHARMEITGHGTKVGPGRRNTWLLRHPKLAPFYGMASAILGAGASWRAIRKTMVHLAISPKVRLHPFKSDTAPALALLGRHQRGSWRAMPRVVIDANLQVAQ